MPGQGQSQSRGRRRIPHPPQAPSLGRASAPPHYLQARLVPTSPAKLWQHCRRTPMLEVAAGSSAGSSTGRTMDGCCSAEPAPSCSPSGSPGALNSTRFVCTAQLSARQPYPAKKSRNKRRQKRFPVFYLLHFSCATKNGVLEVTVRPWAAWCYAGRHRQSTPLSASRPDEAQEDMIHSARTAKVFLAPLGRT